jgi:hypothetical protein
MSHGNKSRGRSPRAGMSARLMTAQRRFHGKSSPPRAVRIPAAGRDQRRRGWMPRCKARRRLSGKQKSSRAYWRRQNASRHHDARAWVSSSKSLNRSGAISAYRTVSCISFPTAGRAFIGELELKASGGAFWRPEPARAVRKNPANVPVRKCNEFNACCTRCSTLFAGSQWVRR